MKCKVKPKVKEYKALHKWVEKQVRQKGVSYKLNTEQRGTLDEENMQWHEMQVKQVLGGLQIKAGRFGVAQNTEAETAAGSIMALLGQVTQ